MLASRSRFDPSWICGNCWTGTERGLHLEADHAIDTCDTHRCMKMKRIWPLCVALVWSQIAVAAPEAPVDPLPDVPDYVATFFVRLSHWQTREEVRAHRGGWTRVDE